MRLFVYFWLSISFVLLIFTIADALFPSNKVSSKEAASLFFLRLVAVVMWPVALVTDSGRRFLYRIIVKSV